jgi:hypothetical protein
MNSPNGSFFDFSISQLPLAGESRESNSSFPIDNLKSSSQLSIFQRPYYFEDTTKYFVPFSSEINLNSFYYPNQGGKFVLSLTNEDHQNKGNHILSLYHST